MSSQTFQNAKTIVDNL